MIAASSYRWKVLVAVAGFLGLASFLAYPSTAYSSLFRQLITSLKITTYSQTYLQLRIVFYILSLGGGLLLVAFFLKKSPNKEKATLLSAVTLAWLSFVIEATVSLGLQLTPLDVWVVLNPSVNASFILFIALFAASLLLLTPYKWARQFGYSVSLILLIISLAGFAMMFKYFIVYSDPFPTLLALMSVTLIESIYCFHKFGLTHSRDNHHTSSYCGKHRFLKSSKLLSVVLVFVMLLDTSAFLQPGSYWSNNYSATNDFYLGISFCGNTPEQGKILIDRVRTFTNLFIVQSLPISQNETALNEICDYAVHSGLKIAAYFSLFNQYWQIHWLDSAKDRWGDKFLGVYLYDEPGGMNIDNAQKLGTLGGRVLNNYTDAANNYLDSFRLTRGRAEMRMLKMRNIRAVTSDYALYWYDYKAGYDVVFAEFAWNYSRQLNVALCRGAADLLKRDWGIMITWTYENPPYIESGDNLYEDAVFAYDNGAKYLIVFNYPYNGTNAMYGVLQEEHLEALNKLWGYARTNPRSGQDQSEKVAFVLPKDFGYGFRGPNDKIWGRWEADDFTNRICVSLNNALEQFGQKLDIIYEDGLHTYKLSAQTYSKIIFWNETDNA